MSLKTNPNSCQEIYESSLKEIAGVTITRRQAEVISCVVHNRGDKKIAAILSVAPRTATTHMHDIFKKFGYNSREQIIDAIEKSGKLKYVKQHYHHILIESYFLQILRKISTILSKQDVTCKLHYEQADVISQEKLLLHITENLELAGIKVIQNANYHDTAQEDKKIIDITIITKAELGLNISNDLLKTGDNKNKGHRIFLLFNKDDHDSDNKTAINTANSDQKTINYINFTDINNYYFAFLELIHKIYNISPFNDALEHLIQDFQSYYNSIINADDNNLLFDQPINGLFIKQLIIKVLNKYISSRRGKIIIFIGTIILASGVFWGIATINNVKLFSRAEQSSTHTNQKIEGIEKTLNQLVDNFSADNVSLQSRDNNHKYIKQVEEILKDTVSYEKEISFAGLMNYLYLINAYAYYEMVNNHNWQEARNRLEHGRNLIIDFINKHNNRNQTIESFDQLTPEEQYSELHIIDELAKIYNRLVYTLGRTYIYEQNAVAGEKYLNIAGYFGKYTKLFDAVSSIRNGSVIIAGDKAKSEIKKGNIEVAKSKIHDIIKIYEYYRNNDTEYIIEYKPGNNRKHITIIPAKDIYNQVFCLAKELEYYSILFEITEDSKKLEEYSQIIAEGYATLLDKLNELQDSTIGNNLRRSATIYNALGDTMLVLYNSKIGLDDAIKHIISQKLSIDKNTNDLEFIAAIFTIASHNSRQTDYTKACAYDGLIKVKEIQLAKKKISVHDISQLKQEIKELAKKRDKINHDLKIDTKATK